ncbi:unnamed protein product [Mytilus coruscus]|uniref:Uncharacterized protein n=1 Tax=Mytilus coruscus TaxID=42192 RepID=A0A6J8AS46_MYTCO|nr:unnamed protein product [Mytilus coruscus]
MITVSVTEVADAQSITAGGSHYDEIDMESDRNIFVSTAANAVVHSDIHLNRGTSEASREISVEAQEMVDDNRMPFTVDIVNEIPVQALQRLEFAENFTKETIAQMIRETQVLVIRETVEQVLKEKASSKHRNTSFTTSSEGDDTSIQTSGSGYLNPYQPLHIDSNLIEHPYTETTL